MIRSAARPKARRDRRGEKSARRPSILRWLSLGLCLLVSACATTRRPLPAVPSEELPARWLSELAGEPCPPPFSARVQIRIEAKGEPALSLVGTLQAVPPDTLKLSAGVGAFRPAFVLLAGADSCELLLHEGGRFWITARESPDWRPLSPASWSAALTWALCPAILFRRLEQEGVGTFDQGCWSVSGAIRGSPWRAAVRVRSADRAVTDLTLSDPGGVLTEIRAARFSTEDGITLPERLEIRSPREGWKLLIQRRSLERLPADRRPAVAPVRPPGWTPGGPEGLDGWGLAAP